MADTTLNTLLPSLPVSTGENQPPSTETSSTLSALIARADDYTLNARSRNTQLAYGKAWKCWLDWCGRLSLDPLCGDPRWIGLYLTEAAERLRPSSIRLHLSAIAAAHRLAGRAVDVRHLAIADVVSGIVREKGRAPHRQSAPVLPENLPRILHAVPSGPTGARDRAIILLGFGAALRRSEIVALDVGDVNVGERGLLLKLDRSKTDQEGDGRLVAIWGAGRSDLDIRALMTDWLALIGRSSGPLFTRIRKNDQLTEERLTDQSVALIVKKAVAAAGLDADRYSGHSLRSGLITTAALNGASLMQIMRQSGHKSVDVLTGYVRIADVWRDNVTEDLWNAVTA